METRAQKYTYGTRGTPTTDALCEAIDALEGSAGTILVPSGLAAVTVPFLAFLSAGDHALIVDSVYLPTRHFCDTMLKRLGVEVEYYDPMIGAGIEQLIKPNTKLVHTEAPGSNTFEMQDIPAISAVAHRHGCVVTMDNTWATPLYFRPLDHGVDISIHAATKYPSGHSDILMGTVSANAAHWEQLKEANIALGICGAPDDAYQILRGLRTMGVRLERHQESALDIAKWLEGREDVARVLHPALPSFPAMISGSATSRARAASSPSCSRPTARNNSSRRRMPSSMRCRSSVSAIPGAVSRALPCTSISTTAGSARRRRKVRSSGCRSDWRMWPISRPISKRGFAAANAV